MKDKDLALKRLLMSNRVNDKRIFVTLRNKSTKEMRKAKANFFISIINEAKGNTKLIWTQIQKLMGSDNLRRSRQLELKDNGNLLQDPADLAKVFNEYFIDSVAEITQCFPHTCVNLIPINITLPVFHINCITDSKVQMLVNSLKPSTTKDVYGMDSAMLKHLKDVLAPPITQIINLSISQGVFPKVWKTAIVSPIFKSGDSQAICNYRPISILPVVSKVAEKWVAEQLISHLNNSPFSLHPMQFGVEPIILQILPTAS